MITRKEIKRKKLLRKLEKNYALMCKYFGGSQKTGNIKFSLKMIIRDIKELPENKFKD